MDMRTCHGPAPRTGRAAWPLEGPLSKGHFCRNKRCDLCGKVGDDTPWPLNHPSKGGIGPLSKGCLSKMRRWGNDNGGEPRLRCDGCGKVHDVRAGTAYGPSKGHFAGIRTDLKTYE